MTNQIHKPCQIFKNFGKCTIPNCNFLHEQAGGSVDATNHNIGKNKKRDNKRNNKLKKVNTESFEPSYDPPDMRIQVESALFQSKTNLKIGERDVCIIKNLFGEVDDLTIYNNLIKEMDECCAKRNIDKEQLWKLWHGDSHLIADDHLNYKEDVPTFMMIVNKFRDYFGMDIKATRFNLYRDNEEWKPYHHDASAVDPRKAKIQNFTLGVSFGATRDVAFEDAVENIGHRRIISIPLENGTTYSFSKYINEKWRHGIPPTKLKSDIGRISIIAWGFVPQEETGSSSTP